MNRTTSQVYLFNSPVMTGYGTWRFEGPLSVDRARELLKDGFTSAVGHPETAKFLSVLLEIPVPKNRITAQLQVGDGAVVLRPKERLPAGKLLSRKEIEQFPMELGWMVRLD